MKCIEEDLSCCVQDLSSKKEESDSWTIVSVFCFPPQFSGFKGHFPGSPVLPAIVQLAAVRHTAEKALDRHLQPVNFSKTKFRSMISPDQEILIRLDIFPKKGQYHSKFQIHTTSGEVVAKGKCTFLEVI